MPNNSAHKYTSQQVEKLLESCLNKTLGEIDKNHVFDRTKTNPKITGIAGDVIEQSVFEYNANSDSSPDLNIDGIQTELKTTGIRVSKKNPKNYEAKEPMSITSVSPNTIIDEEFLSSRFWHKLAHLLLVYYLYASDKTVLASEYANFLVKGYQFLEFSDIDKKILEQDWLIVRNFIRTLNKNEALYPEISHLRDKLLFIDTAPKWPNPPRFRLKRTVVSNIVQKHFNGSLEQLPKSYDTYAEIDKKCHEITTRFKNKTVSELMKEFAIDGKIDKGIGERLVVRMFGGSSKKMQKIDLFNKIGLSGKTIVLTETGKRTEDMKLFRINFDEIENIGEDFSDSVFFDYFSENQILCIIFEEHDRKDFGKNTFLGFKRLSFGDDFIELNVKSVWNRIRELVIYKELKNIPVLDSKGNPKINKTGIPQAAPNFPKSSEGVIFVRGDSSNSTKKPEVVNGINMYRQYIWIKGSYLSQKLDEKDFI
ncbi:MutH/Sau3AI family endonuclease [Treponema pectinovorum]|uniref:MutH/Sau3AI family endonuclease n=1 Tax=Treponema pectinovorum TaxID=164 RepID=UPI0011F29AE7|nr:MutH/Sau3AI family endonuclease [Treponema pectinovorum]